MIPSQLSSQRFIKLRPNSKVPLEKGWNVETNYDYDECKNWDSYGVLCGVNGLVVVDCDNPFADKKLLNTEYFDRTFRVKSANKELHHYYFYVEDPDNMRTCKVEHHEHGMVADIQAHSVQVVGPGSIVNSRRYELVNDSSIINLTWKELTDALLEALPGAVLGKAKAEKFHPKSIDEKVQMDMDSMETDPVCAYIKHRVKVKDVLAELGIYGVEGQRVECPLGHDSVSKKDVAFNAYQFYCHNCGVGGSLFDLFRKAKGLTFKQTIDYWSDKVGVPEQVRREAIASYKQLKTLERVEYYVKKVTSTLVIRTINDRKRAGEREIWTYHDGIYKPHGHAEIQKYLRALLGKYLTKTLLNAVIVTIEADTLIDPENFFNQDNTNYLICLNGLYNIEKNVLERYDSNRVFFHKLNVIYRPDANSRQVTNFFPNLVRHDSDVKTLQEMFGYALWKGSEGKKAFLLLGDGDNGKSGVMSVLEFMLGKPNVSNIPLQDLDAKKSFDNEALIGKYANFGADINATRIADNGNFKMLVAGDSMVAYRKFKSSINFNNFATLIFAANQLPDTDDMTDGFFTRWMIVDFPFKFKRKLDNEDVIMNKHEEMIKIADPKVVSVLKEDYNVSALFNWSLEGLKRLMESNWLFSNQESMEDLKLFWRRRSNSFQAFLEDCVQFTPDEEDCVTLNELDYQYVKYCNKKGKPVVSPQIRREIMSSRETNKKVKAYALGGGMRTTKWVWTNMNLIIIDEENQNIYKD